MPTGGNVSMTSTVEIVPTCAPELTLVVPTFNEQQNIEPLLSKLDAVLRDARWEIIFVDDDSTDGTPLQIEESARGRPNVRLIRRIGRRGLSTAVIEGALSSMAQFIAVMDADMQHDERVLPAMLTTLRTGNYDLLVGTRYSNGGSIGQWSRDRAQMSMIATRVAQMITGVSLSDPMSGFFMITRAALDRAIRRLSGQGFKILLDIATSAQPPLRIAEQPYEFKSREFGESKLDALVAIEFGTLLLDKLIGRWIPVRFLLFVAVGTAGLVVHMTILATLINVVGSTFTFSQSVAAVTSMVFNFFVNNILTYRDQRLKGAKQLAIGLLTFMAVCSFGAMANIGIASFVFEQRHSWWLAGLAGVVIGAVWNYAATSVFTWRAAR